jgi:hypothetical protein
VVSGTEPSSAEKDKQVEQSRLSQTPSWAAYFVDLSCMHRWDLRDRVDIEAWELEWCVGDGWKGVLIHNHGWVACVPSIDSGSQNHPR